MTSRIQTSLESLKNTFTSAAKATPKVLAVAATTATLALTTLAFAGPVRRLVANVSFPGGSSQGIGALRYLLGCAAIGSVIGTKWGAFASTLDTPFEARKYNLYSASPREGSTAAKDALAFLKDSVTRTGYSIGFAQSITVPLFLGLGVGGLILR